MRRISIALLASLALTAPQRAAAQQPSYDRHFLDSTEYFIASHEPGTAWTGVALAQMVAAPTSASRGEAQFLVLGAGGDYTVGQRVWTQYYWKTRPATVEEAGLGATVFCANLQGEGGVYRPPRSRDEAVNGGWWMATISDVSDLHRQHLRAGEYVLGLDCMRVSTMGRPLPTSVAAGPLEFDRDFLDSAEYFIASGPLDGTWSGVAVARMITGPTSTSRGEAQFLIVGSGSDYSLGQRVWTRYYWRTRPATADEARTGRRVFCFNAQDDQGVYRGPRDRTEALNSGWYSATITDIGDLFRQYVSAGEYHLGLGCLRVQR